MAESITTAVTNHGIRARAEALGEQIRAEDGVGAAVDVLTEYMRRREGRKRKLSTIATMG